MSVLEALARDFWQKAISSWSPRFCDHSVRKGGVAQISHRFRAQSAAQGNLPNMGHFHLGMRHFLRLGRQMIDKESVNGNAFEDEKV